MAKKWIAILLMLWALPRPAASAEKKALMLTVFGTSTEASVTFDELVPLVQAQFPGRDVVVPYTSGIIRNKLNAAITAPERKILSPEEMLEKLKKQGYTDIAVASTLLFAGVEHDKLKAAVEKFAGANPKIKVGYLPPLLSDKTNLQPVIDTLQKYRLTGGANLVVAHGTHEGHEAERTYLELSDLLTKTYPDTYMGSIEGIPDMQEALDSVKTSPKKEVRFIVFMFVAGDHAENDIVGSEEDSLFSAVKKMGKNPSVAWTDTKAGKRIASLGLDPEYREILLAYYAKNISK